MKLCVLGKVQLNRGSLMQTLALGKSQESTFDMIEDLPHQCPCADGLTRKGSSNLVPSQVMLHTITINNFLESKHNIQATTIANIDYVSCAEASAREKSASHDLCAEGLARCKSTEAVLCQNLY
jgi:hypothetical protein